MTAKVKNIYQQINSKLIPCYFNFSNFATLYKFNLNLILRFLSCHKKYQIL